MPEKRTNAEIEKMAAIAYWSALGGVEVKEIMFGIDDYLLCVSNAWYGVHSYHRAKIRYTLARNSRAYIRIYDERLYLDDCIRTNIGGK